MITVNEARDERAWDDFLSRGRYRPFLQSWTMGDVYDDVGQRPVRLEIRNDNVLVGICFAHVVPARRGRHLSIPYGPVLSKEMSSVRLADILPPFLAALRAAAKAHRCTFVRMSPFFPLVDSEAFLGALREAGTKPVHSPLHLLAEHLWYLPLREQDPWTTNAVSQERTSEEVFMNLRKTTRNLVRRAEKDGVTIEASQDPLSDLKHFVALHDETRKRHGFTPYTNAFFLAQVQRFAKNKMCTLYLARYQGQVIASAIHMHAFGETSYHHGASADAFKKIPASYLLQWRAIEDAIRRGDRVYNFWGIAPTTTDADGTLRAEKGHPFAGVTLFKTGFGGACLPLAHCIDLPLSPSYWITRLFETARKWKRGF